MFLLWLLACDPGVIDLGKGTDSAAADSTTTDDSSGADDSGGDKNPLAGDYVGTTNGSVAFGGPGSPEQACAGDLNFTVAPGGKVTGTMDCRMENAGAPPLEGELSGKENDGNLILIWTLQVGNSSTEMDALGSIEGKKATLSVASTLPMGETLKLSGTAKRQ
ncbi:MAG TPA: hypothetical protein PKY30_00800 [Myxococcota bacterium]|nr:hypothetical protein [Myxococcota bacterium]HNH45544.1 hypothetical protein [Myxococcota bacterium]